MLMEHIDVAVIGDGQSGLATAHALPRARCETGGAEGVRARGRVVAPLLRQPHAVLARPVRLPARKPFPGTDRDRYPHRDEVVAYLTAYACRLYADIRPGSVSVRSAASATASRWRRRAAAGCPRGPWWLPPGGSGVRTNRSCRAWRSSPGRCCTPPTTAAPHR
ncbi:hypothetical protein GCM10010233_61600 [Streptomyces pseudogriseolus]|nr:hypothetical protein GCM10010233_61600 [Streptomyces gancidicus]